MNLKDFATPRQLEILEAVEKYGTQREAGEALGISRRAVGSALERLKIRADKGLKMAHPNHDIKGVSTLYGPDGEIRQQWVKSVSKQDGKFEAMRQFAEGLAEEVAGLGGPGRDLTPVGGDRDNLTVYPLGDPHLGLMAWKEETGEGFDLEIAYRNMKNGVDKLVSVSADTKTAIILNLGDFFHFDNHSNQTARSKVQLDTDARWGEVMKVGAQLMKEIVNRCLEHHDKLIIKCLIGNHDDCSAYALALILDSFYCDNPKVEVDTSPSIFWYYQWGKNLLGATHGNNIKLNLLSNIMAEDVPELWGKTLFRYWLIGHVHQSKVTEIGSTKIESFRTLAAKDAWAIGKGYRSGRDLTSIVYHKDYGEVARYRIDIEQVI